MGLESGTYVDDLVTTNPVGSTDLKAQGDDHLRLIKAVLKNTFPGADKVTYLQQPVEDATGATTTNLALTTSNYVNITGTATITALGTLPAGVTKLLRFADASVLTHNAASLNLPGAANITTATSDHCLAISLGSGNWRIPFFFRKSGKPLVGSDFASLGILDDLTELTALALDDWLLAGDTDDSGAHKKILPINVLKAVALLTELETLDIDSDMFLVLDSNASNTPKFVFPEKAKVGAAVLADAAPGTLLGIFEDRKAAGTDGGTFSASAWRERDINTEVYDRDGNLSVTSNQITIADAGTYEISWSAPAFDVNRHRSRLYNVTDGIEIALGSSSYSANDSVDPSDGIARVTITGATAFRIEHYTLTGKSTTGFGLANDIDSKAEIYTRVVIRKG